MMQSLLDTIIGSPLLLSICVSCLLLLGLSLVFRLLKVAAFVALVFIVYLCWLHFTDRPVPEEVARAEEVLMDTANEAGKVIKENADRAGEAVRRAAEELGGELERESDKPRDGDGQRSDYRDKLREHCSKKLFARIPGKYVEQAFFEEYLEEFVDGYAEKFGEDPLYPTTVLVGDKSRRRVFLFDLQKDSGEGAADPTRRYKVAIGKHKGKRRTVAGLSKEEMITPEGIFWVDKLSDDPPKDYSNGKDLGPHVISMEAPGDRSPEDDIALHGSKPRVQWTVGKARTFGCLRMYNKDVTELCELLLERERKGIGALVVVTP